MKFEIKGIFVKTLLIILAISFVLFGIINFFSGVGNNNILKINKQKVSANQFSKFLTEKRSQLFNTDLSNEEVEFLNSKNFISLSLSEFASNLLFQNKIEELNLIEPKKVVIEEIYNNSDFKNENGSFDLELYKKILNANNLTEDKYIQYISFYNSKNNLIQLLTLKNLNNTIVLNKIFNNENKYITSDIITIKPENLVSNLIKPSDIQIKDYYNENKNSLTIPETKIIAYTDIDLSKYKLEEAKNKLSNLEDLVLSAKNIDEIIKKFNSKKETIEYGENNKIIPEDLNKEVLDYNEGTFSDLIYKDKSIYRIYYIEKVIPKKFLSLEEATPNITKILMQKEQKENDLLALDRIMKQLRNNNIRMVVLRNDLKLKKNVTIYKNSIEYSDEFLNELYKINKIDTFTNPVFDRENNVYIIGFVKSIKNISDNNTNFIQYKTLNNTLNRSYKNSIMKLFDKYLFDSNKVIVNNKILERLQ
ncbi:MAG: peptidylprolyl isomerase [Rickettsiales bacterium]|nr:peptidylprolyl isomerase [Rickettsiales bacterium]